MRPIRDPEGAESSHIMQACQLEGKNVLEIGCGAGQLTHQYASKAGRTVGIDPEFSDLKLACQDKNQKTSHLSYIQSIGESLPFPAQAFDITIFASSL